MSKGRTGSIPTEESDEADQTRRRKIEHIEICLQENVQAGQSSLFEDISFIHNALPEIDRGEIDLTTNFMGLRANAPLVIAGMTGGHPDTLDINRRLAEAAEELGLPMGVGSQRAAIEDPQLENTFRVVREHAPTVPIIANIGATHANAALDAIEMVNADIVAIHLNPLQEAVQPEGDCDSSGVIERISKIVDAVEIPVIVKETGAGISSSVAEILESIGVSGVDVGGLGGTSWAAVEYYRAKQEKNEAKAQLGVEFWNWGIPTALSVIMVNRLTSLEIIATGGIRSGVDIAKSLAIGASSAGVALPLLEPAVNGDTENVIAELQLFLGSLKTAMYLTGCKTVEEAKLCPLIITGKLREALESINIDSKLFASRP
ncbi:type 2 isopentenyl-diphosphate Delta-isomerase [Candidatus Thorarchaeota archaeon]|nr:MAG: type 2 isopentenyl-diphosphate Delta-isomerase [Candidatus Thorarchaeota archaeon]